MYKDWQFKDGALSPDAGDVANAQSSETPVLGVRIVRDNFGVAHIFATGPTEQAIEENIAFGVGYAQAEERLFQMEVLRHAGEGTPSELVGPGPNNSYSTMDFTSGATPRPTRSASPRSRPTSVPASRPRSRPSPPASTTLPSTPASCPPASRSTATCPSPSGRRPTPLPSRSSRPSRWASRPATSLATSPGPAAEEPVRHQPGRRHLQRPAVLSRTRSPRSASPTTNPRRSHFYIGRESPRG